MLSDVHRHRDEPASMWVSKRTVVSAIAVLLLVVVPARGDDDAQLFASTPAASSVVSFLAFGSCNKHDAPQDYWNTMTQIVDDAFQATSLDAAVVGGEHIKAAAWVWLGDVVYADTKVLPGYWVPSSLDVVAKKYEVQKQHAAYQTFLETSVRDGLVLGVWDDHDYGMNDGGKEHADKQAMQQIFVEFLKAKGGDASWREYERAQRRLISPSPATALHRDLRSSEGLFQFHIIPFAMHPVSQAAYLNAWCVILLDVRYFRDPIAVDGSGDMLGASQWEWLEATLHFLGSHPSTCAATLIGTGIQVILDEKPTENWGNFPHSRNKLFTLIRRHRVPRVVFLSGDVHLGEIARDDSEAALACMGYPIVEVTSSGLTHASGSIPMLTRWYESAFPNSRRQSVYLNKNFGSVALEVTPQDHHRDDDDGWRLVLRVHHLGREGSTGPEHLGGNISLAIPLKQLEPPAAAVVSHDCTYASTPPAGIKRILNTVRRYAFPRAAYHQLINGFLYIGGGGVVLFLLLGCYCFVFPAVGLSRSGSWSGTRPSKDKFI